MINKVRNRKIVAIGNSFGVVIPKQLCRLLRLDRTTEVSVALQNENIVVRAINRADRTGQPDRFRVGKPLAILVMHYGMTPEHFDRLSHDGTSWSRFTGDVEIGGYLDLITVARLDEVLGRRRELERARITETWERTLDVVLLRVPSAAPEATQPSAP